ncbi:hypothetical protein [Domibacillus enclensis]|uniref:XRE family transcriptional regulator n=1 Tax=Domibacillus enclensis TaxID=1017273 RepID=A0A1N7C116_9BACI|nr:hypothetical protein [Domibacillus enclensis]OXS74189.1 hypothetical protein B1B05_17085 [Domibacillus enclensis]SIR57163.1 hypothetical protein SAMN05443094_1119 [Domibacillus enclensis]
MVDKRTAILASILNTAGITSYGTLKYESFMKIILNSKEKKVKDILREYENEFIDRKASHLLHDFIQEKKLKNVEVIERSNVTKDYFYAIYSGKRMPGRDKTLQLAFGMSLSLKETNLFLKTAGHNELYARNKRDLIIMVCLKDCKTLSETDYILYEIGFDPLTPE